MGLRKLIIQSDVAGAATVYKQFRVGIGSRIKYLSHGTAGIPATGGQYLLFGVHDYAETDTDGSNSFKYVLWFKAYKNLTAVGWLDIGDGHVCDIPLASGTVTLAFYANYASAYTFLMAIIDDTPEPGRQSLVEEFIQRRKV